MASMQTRRTGPLKPPLGIGAQEPCTQNEAPAFLDALWWFHQHLHTTKRLPAIAHRSLTVQIDKRNGKLGVEANRLIHMMCVYFRALLRGHVVQASANIAWPSYAWGGLKERKSHALLQWLSPASLLGG